MSVPRLMGVSLPIVDTRSGTCCASFAGPQRPDREVDIPVQALLAASARSDLRFAMRAFYEETDRLIAAHRPTCWNKGQCCDFTRLGSRLFVTALEVCYYLAGHRPPEVTADACPHAYDGACHARTHRPLGCRIYYCDPLAGHWQADLTEERLRELRSLHSELGVPYFYADWITVLRCF